VAGEVFELADEVAFPPPLVDLRFVVVGAEVDVCVSGSDSSRQMIVSRVLPTATIARFLPRRRTSRR
jgi:hypothetical protein